MINLGCTLPNFANNCLHKSTAAMFRSFTGIDEDILEKIREDIVGGPFIVVTRRDASDKTYIRESTNFCKSIVGIVVSQLCPSSMCQAKPVGLYTKSELDLEPGIFKPRQNKTRSLKPVVMSYFQRVRQQCNVESFYMTGTLEKKMHTVLMALVDTAIMCLKQWNAVVIFALIKSLVLLPQMNKISEVFQRES